MCPQVQPILHNDSNRWMTYNIHYELYIMVWQDLMQPKHIASFRRANILQGLVYLQQ